MARIQLLLKELEQEALTTRKMLGRLPEDKYNWQPHPKSMKLIQLATHVAELPSWVGMVLNTTELDFATSPYTPVPIANNQELLSYFEKSLSEGIEELKKASEAPLDDEWILREGDVVYSKTSKYDMIRMTLSQIIHHRAQLGVYLRLLNVPIPGSYGPSADDESEFQPESSSQTAEA
ncbi:DinB family protein [Pedobacter sp. SYSU D00535]|uniref:DinB family protein n=1 Tax=Pedobacter sp. SYSU D00535 TaxID=2810308 RepID=UPI001A95A735|nr:DinB family protein [Pedobacter sp. SYSU D00535]